MGKFADHRTNVRRQQHWGKLADHRTNVRQQHWGKLAGAIVLENGRSVVDQFALTEPRVWEPSVDSRRSSSIR